MNPVARYAVQLDGGGNGLLLKADNLVPTARAPPSSRTRPAPSQPATQSIASSGAAPLPMEWSEALALARTELAQLHVPELSLPAARGAASPVLIDEVGRRDRSLP